MSATGTSAHADELRDLVGGLAADGSPLGPRLRELGLTRIGIPEERGGSGGTLADLLVVVAELARHGTSAPLIEAATANWVRAHTGPLDDTTATVTLSDTPRSESESVTAELPAVPWARDADRLVLCTPGAAPLAIDLHHPTVTVSPGENLAGEPRDAVRLAATPAEPLRPTVTPVQDRLALLWSAALTGAGHGAYELTKAYVTERRQFEAPLLKIPAVATNLALMRVHLVQADAALASAGEAADVDMGTTTQSATARVMTARIITARMATEVARIAHQLHGAMGITAEYPLHHRTRRLWAWRDAVSPEREWERRLGRAAAAAGETGVWTQLTAVTGPPQQVGAPPQREA